MACLLRVVEAVPGTVTSNIARSWIPKLGQGNAVGLNSRVFDIVLEAVVETKGAKIGMILWDLFCTEPIEEDNDRGWIKAAHTKLVSTHGGLELRSEELPHPRSKGPSRSNMLPIKIERSRPTTTQFYVGGHREMDGTSDDAIGASEPGAETFKEDNSKHLHRHCLTIPLRVLVWREKTNHWLIGSLYARREI